MANDHDIHTCGCDICESRYAARYNLYKNPIEKGLSEYNSEELKEEIKRRKLNELRTKKRKIQNEINKLVKGM